jgi:hypothetical protein
MDPTAALGQLRDRLEATFGKALAVMIVASASNASGVSTVALTADEFRNLAEAVAKDQRVVDMWGHAGASDAANQWIALVA